MSGRRRSADIDAARVGLSFIEVLFALVVARTLDPFTHVSKIPGVGLSHLGVAFVLTVTSWIGYHNSWNRPRYFIRFPNLPLWQFTIDVGLVIAYWICAISAEGTGSDLGAKMSARPEVVIVAISFVLYCFWDWVGLAIRRSERYPKRPEEMDIPARRRVTWAGAVAGCLLAAVTWFRDPGAASTVVIIDLALIVLILAFRFGKECVTPYHDDTSDADVQACKLQVW